MSIIIEFCTSNSYFGTDKVLQTLEAKYDCQVIEYGRLTRRPVLLDALRLCGWRMGRGPTAEERLTLS